MLEGQMILKTAQTIPLKKLSDERFRLRLATVQHLD